MPRPATARAAAALLPLLGCGACAHWFLSGLPEVDRSRPVALIETTGGVEYGATTELGVLTLGRTAQAGPCRVHYFLGRAPMLEDGAIEATGTAFYRARMDLRTQHVRVHDRPLAAGDELVAMYTPDGTTVVAVDVRTAAGEQLQGDLLHDPGEPLPAGAALFVRHRDDYRFCGLVAGKATLQQAGGSRSYYVFAGLDRVRELLAQPEPHPTDTLTRHRPDDITVTEPRR